MAEKSYTMDDLSLVKTEETVPLKRRSSQGDQPSRDNVSINVVLWFYMNVTFGNKPSQIFLIFFQIYHSNRKSSLLCWSFCWEEQMLEISLILMVPLLQSSQTMSVVIGSVWQKWRHHTAAFLELVNLC